MWRHLLLLSTLCLMAHAAEKTVELEAVRAPVGNIYFRVECAADATTVTEIFVTWVAPGSGAEKSGLRAGDRLMTIDRMPVAGRSRREIVNQSGGVVVRGREVSFTGRRGFFRRDWSLVATIDAHGNLEPKEKGPGRASELAPGSVMTPTAQTAHRP